MKFNQKLFTKLLPIIIVIFAFVLLTGCGAETPEEGIRIGGNVFLMALVILFMMFILPPILEFIGTILSYGFLGFVLLGGIIGLVMIIVNFVMSFF